MPTSWLEISEKNIVHNIKSIKFLLGKKTNFIAVVKANAYGHGIVAVSKIAEKNGVDMLAVFSLEEAEILRKNKITKPILILGYVFTDDLSRAVKLDCHVTVYDLEIIEALGLMRPDKAKIHIKVETGLNRQGIALKDLPQFLKLVKVHKNIEIVGIFSHFADSDNKELTKSQLEKFKKAIKICNNNGVYPQIKHIASTGSVLTMPESYFNAVRIGLGIYGLWPSLKTKLAVKEQSVKIELKPAMSWKTAIIQIKYAGNNNCVGYGCAEKTKRKTKIAVLPVGYWDGYGRGLSKIGEILIHGKRCKVLGRICMNMTIIDATNVPDAQIGNEAVLLGKQEQEEITAEEIAEHCGTINYEIVARINPLLPRVYL
ncbi:MAG: alanine racemase [Patescibacteria group bacterium]|mgnify:CR=1 FL=1